MPHARETATYSGTHALRSTERRRIGATHYTPLLGHAYTGSISAQPMVGSRGAMIARREEGRRYASYPTPSHGKSRPIITAPVLYSREGEKKGEAFSGVWQQAKDAIEFVKIRSVPLCPGMVGVSARPASPCPKCATPIHHCRSCRRCRLRHRHLEYFFTSAAPVIPVRAVIN